MAPKLDLVYSRGRSKFVAPSRRMVIGSDDNQDPEYVPPGTRTPTCAAMNTRGTPKKMASGVVTASPSDEERILNDTRRGLLQILRKRLAPRRLPGLREHLALRRLPGLRKHHLHMVPLLLLHQSTLPRLMRLTVRILLHHP